MSHKGTFNRHDLAGSERFLSKLRPKGRFRRWEFSGGKYNSHHPNRYYGVRSTAFEALYAARGYKDKAMGVYLDAGCGDSADADIALVTGYSKAYGIDLFRPMIHLSDKDYKGWFSKSPMRLSYKFILGDMCEQIPLEGESIDAISSSYVIPLMNRADRLSFYKQAHRLLKSGGLLVLSADVLTPGYGHDDQPENGYTQSYFYIPKEKKRLESAGFKVTGRGPNTLIATKPNPQAQ